MGDNSGESAPFNMAALYYYKLAILIEKKDDVALGDDYESYHKHCKIIWNKIHFQMNEDERNKISELFCTIDKKIQGMRITKQRGVGASSNSKLLFELLYELDRAMMDCMHTHKMIFPSVEMRAGLAAMEKRYNLDNGKDSPIN